MMYGQNKYRNRRKDNIANIPAQKKIFAVAVFMSVMFAGFQMLVIKNGYDYSTGIFSGKMYIAFYAVCAVVSAVCCAAIAFAGKDFHYSLNNELFGVMFSSSLCLTFLALFAFYNLFFGTKDASVIDIISYVLALVSCVYFCEVTMHLFEGYRKRRFLAAFCMVLVLQFIFRILSMYFKVSGSYNDPVWNIHNFAQISLMLYFLQESRFWLKRAKPKSQHVIACAAVFLCMLSVFARLTCAILTGAVQATDMLYAAFTLSCVIYISFRILGR